MFCWTGAVETVMLLSQQKPDDTVHIGLDMDETQVTKAESKATYAQIQAYVEEKYGFKVSTLYIAQVKQKFGIIERECYNAPKSEDSRQPKCSPEKEEAIKAALKHFRMI